MLKKIFILIVLNILVNNSFAQIPGALFPETRLARLADTIYHPTQNGLQMIEVDHYSNYSNHMMKYVDKGFVPPYGGKSINEYFIQDSTGKIIKTFNTDKNTFAFRPRYYKVGNVDGHFDVFENSKQGVIDSFGNIIVPIKYDGIIHKGNCFLIIKDEKWNLFFDKKEVSPVYFDRYYSRDPIVYFSDDKEIKLAYNCETHVRKYFSNQEAQLLDGDKKGIIKLKENEKWGLWDLLINKQVIPYEYDLINYFSYLFQPKYGNIIIVSKNGKQGLISYADEEVNVLLKCKYNKIYPSKTDDIPFKYKEDYITTEKRKKIKEVHYKDLPLKNRNDNPP